MNVAFPLEGTAAGFWVYLAIMVAAGSILYLAVPPARLDLASASDGV